jgi:subtilisin family serine protease
MALPRKVFAQASPPSVGGVSMFAEGKEITTRTVAGFRSEARVVKRARDRLRRAGFDVLDSNELTIAIAGSPATYERAFGYKLKTVERPVRRRGKRVSSTHIDVEETPIQGLIDTSRSSLGDVIEGVAIEEPVTLHAPKPKELPPRVDYWHLEVPGDVSLGINADKIHREGLTGRGVKLVMVDSGWYRHPYFEARGYRAANVVLGPGTTRAAHDEIGHGTGESANAFAAAPDIEFTMVKLSFTNSVGSFNRAVNLAPDVISCSWGYPVPKRPLAAIHRALAASVAQAVASGIVVVFSAGNGDPSFPGQHPDVISAGGVYLDKAGRLRASNYVSGYRSKVYPARKVPDLSGLVGQQPYGIYIMLPVEPRDELDGMSAIGKHPHGDETKKDDGWAAFSGTSAAAPQIAGVCALIKEACPALSPAEVKTVLRQTARDVTEGTNFMGEKAKQGRDLATGAGLVNAAAAVRLAKKRCGP